MTGGGDREPLRTLHRAAGFAVDGTVPLPRCAEEDPGCNGREGDPPSPAEEWSHPKGGGGGAGRVRLLLAKGTEERAALSATLALLLASDEPVILVTVTEALGSTPREAGAAMLVTTGSSVGTIGGGQLEYHAIDTARAMLARGEDARVIEMPLGPLLGQCCGGRVRLSLDFATPEHAGRLAACERDAERSDPTVLILGCGHTGRALARALAPLPFRTAVVDDRLELDEAELPVRLVRLDDPAEAVASAAPGTAFVILTHSHALDYRLADAALRRGDAAYVGMIGSATKRARFEAWFRQCGGDTSVARRLVCPIGGRVPDKRPEMIAALVAAELIQVLAQRGAAAAIHAETVSAG